MLPRAATQPHWCRQRHTQRSDCCASSNARPMCGHKACYRLIAAWGGHTAHWRLRAASGEVSSSSREAEDSSTSSANASLEMQLKNAFNAGYQAGVKVQVKVSLDEPTFMQRRRPAPQSEQQVAADGTQNGVQRTSDSAAAAAATAAPTATGAAAPAAPVQARAAGSSSTDTTQEKAPAPDSILRSALKGLAWRVFSTTATVGVALIIFHDQIQVEDALKFGALEFVIKFALYFAHERLWASVKVL